MSRKPVFYLLASFGSLFIVTFLFRPRYFYEPLKCQTQPTVELQQIFSNDIAPSRKIDATPNYMQQIIDQQRRMIRDTMNGYEYPRGRYHTSAEKLEDLLINENGRPIRSIVVSSWRSGSSFFGDILASHPASFYHYEPLFDFDIVRIRGPPLAADALNRAKALFNCDYSKLEKYVDYYNRQPLVFSKNAYLWKECKTRREICYSRRFLSEMCKLFPFQSMKFVRLRLSVAQELLADENLGIRMVLLVRDPRGIIQSRNQRLFCRNKPDCSDPALLCADLSSDYKIAMKLVKKYPTRFRVIRYEDLSAAPYERARELTQFYGLDFHGNVKKFLDTHTKHNKGNAVSTFRDSKTAPYHWKTELTFEEVEEIQRYCLPAMQQWGYLPAENVTHQRTFDPVTNYVLEL